MTTTSKTVLIRIVQLTLHPEKTDEFINLFDNVSQQIRSFDGCEHLELLQHPAYHNLFSTYSHWRSEESLNQYRESELFKSTWAETKALFVAPPKAVSYQRIRHFP